MTFAPSPYQLAIYAHLEDVANGSLMVDAVAGSGKTTTIVNALDHLPEMPTLFLAFNKSIAGELDARTPRHVMCKTFHSLGWNALRNLWGKVPRVDASKTWRIMDGRFPGYPGLAVHDSEHYGAFVKRLVGLAKSAGIGATEDITTEALDALATHHDLYLSSKDASWGRALELTGRVLDASRRIHDSIDYDDMLWLPVHLGARFRRYPLIFVDEAQDTNELQGVILAKSMARNGRVVFVGDPGQAIYGFRGADASAMDRLQERFDCTRLPLSVSYRCAQGIVAEANRVNTFIEAFDGAPEGTVEELVEYTPETFDGDSAILCRNAAPLVSMAYGFIGRGHGVRFLGRDIGAGLAALVKKLNAKGIDRLLAKLDTWEEREVARFEAARKEAAVAGVEDKATCLRTIIAHLKEAERTVPGLLRSIQDLFDERGKDGLVTLCTIHKSKGLEWGTVYVLDRDLMPSKWAKKPWMQVQETNLEYVAITRAKTTLRYITSGGWMD